MASVSEPFVSATDERLSLFCNGIAVIVNSHDLSACVFDRIKAKMKEFFHKIEARSGDVEVNQAGSSYDNLHMTRLLKIGHEEVFVPATDFDFVIILKQLRIASKVHDKECNVPYFGILHSSNNTGYAKVKLTQQGMQIIKDRKCEYMFEDINPEGFMSNFALKRRVLEKSPLYEMSGPALSDFFPAKLGYSFDYVFAFPVDGWPNEAAEWVTRDRPVGWPSQELVSRIVKDGCMVVPVGHYTSEESALEWRISFIHGERLLATSLNEVQRHCYCLTKLLLKTSLPDGCILSSYHMKNLFFYMLESRPELKWESENLGHLIMELLREILRALANHTVPNYLIPQNNMIRHRTSDEVRFTLREVSRLAERPFIALAALCETLQFYEIPTAGQPVVENDLASCLRLYAVFVQILYRLGTERLSDNPFFSSSCFKLICRMNTAMAEFPKQGILLTSKSVADLLIALALQNVKLGKVDEALVLHKIIYENSSRDELKKYPQILPNLGCLYNCLAETHPKNSSARNENLTKAKRYFEEALKVNGSSHSLHFTYGNFLYSNNLSFSKALSHFQEATLGKDDTEIFISVEIPQNESRAKLVTIDSTTASFYFLSLCHNDLQDIYSLRSTLKKFAEVAYEKPVTKRPAALELCALAHGIGGLQIKASFLMEDAGKADKAVKFLQKDKSLADMFKKFKLGAT